MKKQEYLDSKKKYLAYAFNDEQIKRELFEV